MYIHNAEAVVEGALLSAIAKAETDQDLIKVDRWDWGEDGNVMVPVERLGETAISSVRRNERSWLSVDAVVALQDSPTHKAVCRRKVKSIKLVKVFSVTNKELEEMRVTRKDFLDTFKGEIWLVEWYPDDYTR
jgi:hypothetical protein